ncbi:MAG TPA: bifunctional phosphoribosylaminoimidazolecarboxamide formyltransferase/IMP cyclohydrolase [Thermoanaerobaculia bacterium]|jgi:phosphoribosylaminoimidazolecarboxamide formyltransferase/IMP cyclohydrolase
MRNIERAILSVSDKTGIIELARALHARGVEILSTGGTAKHLAANGVAVTPIAAWSGAPEILGGRVKTLTPRVFGAILYDRDNDAHRGDVERLSIPPIDLVVVNLYPFEATIAREGVTVDEAIEQIDIGGPSMLRAAAKNHKHVLPLPDPSLYAGFLREFESGAISDDFRRRCAVAVFEKTSRYDAAIARFLSGGGMTLRYGENPQQSATFHGGSFTQLQGKELSYNNLLDLDAAMRLAHAFREPAAAVIKHTNPCGVARRETYAEALRAAVEADPVSAYGGIVGANREFDDDAARVIETLFLEVIVAPSFSEGARAILAKKKNLRLIEAPPPQNDVELRSAAGGILEQSVDRIGPRENWRVVTERQPSKEELRGLEFAWIVCAHVKSNAIVITSEAQSIGIGAGQMSRVDAAKLAVTKATRPTAGAYAASDAFFPFRDGLDILADAGVRAVIQPGGSVRDAEVIAAANERGVAMVLTGERHFRH